MTKKQEIISCLFQQDLINFEEMMILLETEKEYINVPSLSNPIALQPTINPFISNPYWPNHTMPYYFTGTSTKI